MIKNVFKSLSYNIKTLLKFELIYKLLTIFIFSPLFSLSFKLIMRITGYKFLSYENITSFLRKPESIIMILFLLIIMAVYTLFEISTIIIITNASMQKIKISLRESLIISFDKLKTLIKRSRLGLVFIVLFLIPFLNIGIATSYISVIRVPSFILDFIKANPLYFTLYIVGMLALLYLLLRWIYTINYMVIDNLKFSKARSSSKKLGYKNHLKDFFKILLTEGIIYLSFILFIGLGILIIYLVYRYVNFVTVINSLFITVIWMFLTFALVVFSLVSIPLAYASISYLFYKHKDEHGEDKLFISFDKLQQYREESKKNVYNRFYKIKFAIFLLLFISGTIFTYGATTGKFSLNINHTYNVELTAHRGSSVKYPENTMLAFKMAREEGADWIELDVQMTKDGYLVISHDSNLKRIAGINKNIYDLTYEELSNIKVNDSKYKNEHIPLLDEVIDWAVSHNIKLNIELKPTGKEIDFEQSVVDLIVSNGFTSNCVVTSGNYEILSKVKSYNKNIKTIYVMSLAYGDIISIDDVDGYSVEANNVTKKLVKKVHKKNKELYVWTVNDEEVINNMIKYNVDNIITDDIIYAKNVIDKSKQSNLILDYIDAIRRTFG